MANVFEMCDYNHEKSSFTSCYYEVNYDCEAVSLRVSTSGSLCWVRKGTTFRVLAYWLCITMITGMFEKPGNKCGYC